LGISVEVPEEACWRTAFDDTPKLQSFFPEQTAMSGGCGAAFNII
jgi:hypothetical protein